jgi:hypothetical protein
MKMLTASVLLLLSALAASIVSAQSAPTIEVILSQPSAARGDVVGAEVVIRGGDQIGGIDIGIAVDETCLRIIDRQPGGYLPTTEGAGASSPFAVLNEHDTRYAAALTDRTKHVSGDGVFYRVSLEVICDLGEAPLTVTYAKVSSYIDPDAEIIDIVSFDLAEGTLSVIGTTLSVIPASEVTVVPTLTSIPTQIATRAIAEPTAAVTPDTTLNNTLVLLVMVLGSLVLALLATVFILLRRKKRDDDKQ